MRKTIVLCQINDRTVILPKIKPINCNGANHVTVVHQINKKENKYSIQRFAFANSNEVDLHKKSFANRTNIYNIVHKICTQT